MAGIGSKIGQIRGRIQKDKNFGIQSFLIIVAIGYCLFFTSSLWMPENEKLVKATPYYEKVSIDKCSLYLTQFAYSEKDAAIQVILEMENEDVKEQEFEYSAVERSAGSLDVEAMQQGPDYLVLRIAGMGSRWKEISLRLQAKGGEMQVKFYTNVNEIERVASLPRLSGTGYRIERMQGQIAYDDAQIKKKRKDISSLKEENRKIAERIGALQEETYLTDEEAQKAKDIIRRAEGEKKSNKGAMQDKEGEIRKIQKRSDNIREQIKRLEEK